VEYLVRIKRIQDASSAVLSGILDSKNVEIESNEKKKEKDDDDDDDDDSDEEEKRQLNKTFKAWLSEFLNNNNNNTMNLKPGYDESPASNHLLDICLIALENAIDRDFKKRLSIKTDYIEHLDDVKLTNERSMEGQEEVDLTSDKNAIYYETEQHYTDLLFEQATNICFGKHMCKLGCEYTLFWQHCYKTIFKLFDDDNENEDLQMKESAQNYDHYQGAVGPLPGVKHYSNNSNSNIKKRLMKQPNMNKVKVRNEKYKQLANIMKQYIVMELKDGKLVHVFKSPCPLQCTECIYRVKKEKFTFFYFYENKRFQVSMDPLKGSAMVQHYSKKIVELMD
jgi:hypothetical protein